MQTHLYRKVDYYYGTKLGPGHSQCPVQRLNLVLTFIPRLFGFLVILLVGWLIATLVSKALTMLLRKVGFDRMSERIGLNRFEERMGVKMDSAGILGKIVYWFILLIFLVPAADALGCASRQ